jgi:uncharacterized protein
MNKKPGRNDPCPCGSGKKYKQCCLLKNPTQKQKITAKWLNRPQIPNLMDRTFGDAIAHTEKTFKVLADANNETSSEQKKENLSEGNSAT